MNKLGLDSDVFGAILSDIMSKPEVDQRAVTEVISYLRSIHESIPADVMGEILFLLEGFIRSGGSAKRGIDDSESVTIVFGLKDVCCEIVHFRRHPQLDIVFQVIIGPKDNLDAQNRFKYYFMKGVLCAGDYSLMGRNSVHKPYSMEEVFRMVNETIAGG